MESKVSIIVPVYNAEKYLVKCVNSLRKQTFQDISIVLIDDGSKDNSGKICDRLAKEDRRITVIHQENKGSVEARKTGIYSKIAQEAKYLMLCDADDTMPFDAVTNLLTVAEAYQADCVCGKIIRMWKGISLTEGFRAPCFKTEEPKAYIGKDIIDQLYIGCFGVNNFPVSLCAKLYRKEILTEAADFEPIVRFIGDDLSVTMRMLPLCQTVVVVPETVYHYRIGGGTSRFMPHMWEDFLALYHAKKELLVRYPMPQDAQLMIDFELLNIVPSWLKNCVQNGKFTKERMKAEIVDVCTCEDVLQAAKGILEKRDNHRMSHMILNQQHKEIEAMIYDQVNRSRYKTFIKKIIMKL